MTAKIKTFNKSFRSTWQLHMLVLPGFILLVVFGYIPLMGITLAFKEFSPVKGIWGSNWTGLENFKYMLSLPDTFTAIKNTFIISILKIVLSFPVPIVFALLLNEVGSKLCKKLVQTSVYLPYFVSWVLLAGIMIDMFSSDGGLVNQIIGVFGVKPLYFLGDNRLFIWVIIFSDIWKTFGYLSVIYLAALTNIDPGLYEASYMDGANRWQQTWHITIPGILPVIVLMSCLSLGNIMNANFDQIFNLYNPMVYQSSDIIDTLVYRITFLNFDYSLGTALGLFKGVVSFIMLVAGYRLAYRTTGYKIF